MLKFDKTRTIQFVEYSTEKSFGTCVYEDR